MNFLLDTDVMVGYLRNKPGAWELVDKLLDLGELKINIITFGELEYGVNLARDTAKEKEKIVESLDDLRIEVIGLTVKTMEIYGRVRRELEVAGEGLDDFDLLIGATAVENELELVTNNLKHFARFPGLRIYGNVVSS